MRWLKRVCKISELDATRHSRLEGSTLDRDQINDKIKRVFDPWAPGHDAASDSHPTHPIDENLKNWLSSLRNNESAIADDD